MFKGSFPTNHMHPARVWCDVIEPKDCQVLATFAKDFYAGRPALTLNYLGQGAIALKALAAAQATGCAE